MSGIKFRKRKSTRRPGYKSCGWMVAKDAQKALGIALSVKRLLNVEIKDHIVNGVSTAVVVTPGIIKLTDIAQGSTTNTRDGAQLKVVGIDFNYSLTIHASALTTRVRVMLVIDKQTNQAIYVSTDLLRNIAVFQGDICPRNLDNMKRFTVLYDKTHLLSAGSTGQVVVRKYIRKEVLIRYDAAGASIADITQNSLSMLHLSSETTNTPLLHHFIRVRYIDN